MLGQMISKLTTIVRETNDCYLQNVSIVGNDRILPRPSTKPSIVTPFKAITLSSHKRIKWHH
uniref:Uncharacterized protein n=1 Tax=Arundo donax TaxID=35708 RepID=A0A0A9BT47_ARUDO